MNKMKTVGEMIEGFEFDNLMSKKIQLDLQLFQKELYIKRLKQDKEILIIIVKALAKKLKYTK